MEQFKIKTQLGYHNLLNPIVLEIHRKHAKLTWNSTLYAQFDLFVSNFIIIYDNFKYDVLNYLFFD